MGIYVPVTNRSRPGPLSYLGCHPQFSIYRFSPTLDNPRVVEAVNAYLPITSYDEETSGGVYIGVGAISNGSVVPAPGAGEC